MPAVVLRSRVIPISLVFERDFLTGGPDRPSGRSLKAARGRPGTVATLSSSAEALLALAQTVPKGIRSALLSRGTTSARAALRAQMRRQYGSQACGCRRSGGRMVGCATLNTGSVTRPHVAAHRCRVILL